MHKRLPDVLAGAVLCAALHSHAGEMPVIVTQVTGAARFEERPLALLDSLKSGDTVELATGATLVLFRTTQTTLTGPGRFMVNADGIVRQGSAGNVRVENQAPALANALKHVPRQGTALAGAIVRGEQPASDIERLSMSRPLFSWSAKPHRGPWRFRLTDDAENVVFETTTTELEMTLPKQIRLIPEAHYRRELRWLGRENTLQLEVKTYQVLSKDEDAQLVSLLPPVGAEPAARVLFALYLRGVGVRELAIQMAPEIRDVEVAP